MGITPLPCPRIIRRLNRRKVAKERKKRPFVPNFDDSGTKDLFTLY